MKELKEILEEYRRRVTSMKEFFDTKPTGEALSAILTLIESKLPNTPSNLISYHWTDEHYDAWNAYRQQALKNFGIKAQEEKYGLF